MAQLVKNLPANAGDTGSIPGSGRSSGEGNGNPLQYFCLGNPMDRGVRRVTVRGLQRVGHDLVTKQHWFTALNKSICTTLCFYFSVPSRILTTKNFHPSPYSCSPLPFFLGFCPLPSSTSLVTTTLFSLIYVM